MSKDDNRTVNVSWISHPEILASSDDAWEEHVNRCGLQEWKEQMCLLDQYCPPDPPLAIPVPLLRGPDKTKDFEGQTYGGITIQRGDTLWELFGLTWPYVSKLKVNGGRFDNPKDIQPGQVIYFPISCEVGDPSIWTNQCIDLTIPEAGPAVLDVARAFSNSCSPSNTASSTCGALIKGSLEWKNKILHLCGGMRAVEVKSDYIVCISPKIKDRTTYAVGSGAQSKIKKKQIEVNASNKDLVIKADNTEFSLDKDGLNVKLENEFGSVVNFSKEGGPSVEIPVGYRITFGPKYANVEISGTVGANVKGVNAVIKAKFTNDFMDANGNVLLTFTQEYSAKIEINPGMEIAGRLACTPIRVRVPEMNPKPFLREVADAIKGTYDEMSQLEVVTVAVLGAALIVVLWPVAAGGAVIGIPEWATAGAAGILLVPMTAETEREIP